MGNVVNNGQEIFYETDNLRLIHGNCLDVLNVFGSNAQLRALAEFYASSGGQTKFIDHYRRSMG